MSFFFWTWNLIDRCWWEQIIYVSQDWRCVLCNDACILKHANFNKHETFNESIEQNISLRSSITSMADHGYRLRCSEIHRGVLAANSCVFGDFQGPLRSSPTYYPWKMGPRTLHQQFLFGNVFLCGVGEVWGIFPGYVQWLFLVPVKGGRDYIIPQKAIYKWYISGIYWQLGDYIPPTTL